MASAGTFLTWSSPVLPQLLSEDSPLGEPITEVESSWIASIYLLGIVVGCFPAYWCIEQFGRKPTLLISTIPIGVPWFVMLFLKSPILLCIFRFIGGTGIAFPLVGLPIYISEIADKDIRGNLSGVISVLKFTGSLYVLGVGPFISYIVLTLTCAILPIIFLVTFYFMPESPYYLIKVNKRKEAYENLKRLLGTSDPEILEKRIKEIEYMVQYDMKSKSNVCEFFTKKEYRKSLIIIIGVKTLQAFGGTYTITSYIQMIIEASKSNISPEISSVVSGVAQIVAALLASILIDRLGRKILFLISTFGCAISLFGEGLYFYLRNEMEMELDDFGWLPTVCLLIYFLTNTIGIYALPFVLLGELFATNVKGFAVAIFSSYGIGIAFLVTKAFQPISSLWGMHVIFWTFTVACLLGSAFIYFVLPETKGKTLEEIQKILNPERRTEDVVMTAHVT